ncbi:hypothetical protein AWZ03_012918, partial [Drosophila navojoa]
RSSSSSSSSSGGRGSNCHPASTNCAQAAWPPGCLTAWLPDYLPRKACQQQLQPAERKSNAIYI